MPVCQYLSACSSDSLANFILSSLTVSNAVIKSLQPGLPSTEAGLPELELTYQNWNQLIRTQVYLKCLIVEFPCQTARYCKSDSDICKFPCVSHPSLWHSIMKVSSLILVPVKSDGDICVSVCLPPPPPHVSLCLCVCVCVFVSVCLCVCVSLCLFVRLRVRVSLCLCFPPSLFIPLQLAVRLSAVNVNSLAASSSVLLNLQ